MRTLKNISHSKQTALNYVKTFGSYDEAIENINASIEVWHRARRGKSMVKFFNVVKRHILKLKKNENSNG